MSDSYLEARFLKRWQQKYPDLPLTREYQFHPKRKLRFDFAVLPLQALTAIEIQGGIWQKGSRSHGGGVGIQNDYKKLCLAQYHGWAVFMLSRDMINSDAVLEMIAQTIRHRIGVSLIHNQSIKFTAHPLPVRPAVPCVPPVELPPCLQLPLKAPTKARSPASKRSKPSAKKEKDGQKTLPKRSRSKRLSS